MFMQNKQCLLKISLINLLPCLQIQEETLPQAQHTYPMKRKKALLFQAIVRVPPVKGDLGINDALSTQGKGDQTLRHRSIDPWSHRCSPVLEQALKTKGVLVGGRVVKWAEVEGFTEEEIIFRYRTRSY